MVVVTTNCIESYNKAEYPAFAPLYEDGVLDVCVVASVTIEKTDYGVPRSPVWNEVTDVEIEEYEVNGVAYSPKDLRAKFGKALEMELHKECASEVAEGEF